MSQSGYGSKFELIYKFKQSNVRNCQKDTILKLMIQSVGFGGALWSSE